MFYLEFYKLIRSKALILMTMSLIVPFIFVFFVESENPLGMLYNPFLQKDDLMWLNLERGYNFFFIMFFPPFLIILYAWLIYFDKDSGLLRCFSIFRIPKIRFWLIKYLFIQLLSLIYITLYIWFPVLIYILVYSAKEISITFLFTGLFLVGKCWLSLLAITTLTFLANLVFPLLYQGLLFGLGLFFSLFVLPISPAFFFWRQNIFFQDLSHDRLPFWWTLEFFKWELMSVIVTLISILVFIIAAFILRRTTRFQQLLFGFIFIGLISASCNQDIKDQEQIANMPMAAKDSSLVQWLDTVQVTDTGGQTFVLSDLLQSVSAKVLYLDFWNSHCIPCMKAFPGLNELASQYPVEELKIIYLNSDEDPERWEKALSFTGNLSLPDHYRVRYPDFKIMAKVGLNIYPRYMVMNQKREMVELRAPLPHKEYIDSLLIIE